MSIVVHNCPFCDHDDVEIGEVAIGEVAIGEVAIGEYAVECNECRAIWLRTRPWTALRRDERLDYWNRAPRHHKESDA